jgi:hypothetical protein
MSRYNDDQGQGMLVPILMVGIVFAVVFYFTALQIPAVQYVLFFAYILIRVFGAVLALDFAAAGRLMEILAALAEGMKTGLKPNPGAIWETIRQAGPNPLWVGFVVSALFGLVVAMIFLRRRNISEEKVVRAQKKKSLEETAKEWGIDPGVFREQDLVKLATAFAEIRKDRNIPPNVIARKINDPERRMAVLHFDRIIKLNETLQRITDPKEVHRIIRENMPEGD